MKGQEVNRTGLSDVFGVSMPTVDTWVRDGCPVVSRGAKGVQWVFNTADIAKWLRERAVKDATGDTVTDDAEIDRRTKSARMRMAELELAKEAGLVAPIEEFKRVQAARAAMVRANMLNIPARAALRLLAETDETTFKRVLREEVTLALRTAYETPVELADDAETDSGE